MIYFVQNNVGLTNVVEQDNFIRFWIKCFEAVQTDFVNEKE
jgi:hypothetical protein